MTDTGPRSEILSDYQLILRRHKQKFHIELPELSISVNDKDLQAAYDKLEESLEAALKEYQDGGGEAPPPAGIDSAIVRRGSSSPGRGGDGQIGFMGEMGTFMAKTAIVSVIAGAILIFGASYAFNSTIKSMIYSAISAVPRVLTENLATQTYIAIHQVAVRLEKATPEEREALHRDLRVIARDLRPFVEEMAQPFTSPPSEKQ